jgi:hypothetical protein
VRLGWLRRRHTVAEPHDLAGVEVDRRGLDPAPADVDADGHALAHEVGRVHRGWARLVRELLGLRPSGIIRLRLDGGLRRDGRSELRLGVGPFGRRDRFRLDLGRLGCVRRVLARRLLGRGGGSVAVVAHRVASRSS